MTAGTTSTRPIGGPASLGKVRLYSCSGCRCCVCCCCRSCSGAPREARASLLQPSIRGPDAAFLSGSCACCVQVYQNELGRSWLALPAKLRCTQRRARACDSLRSSPSDEQRPPLPPFCSQHARDHGETRAQPPPWSTRCTLRSGVGSMLSPPMAKRSERCC